MSLVAQVAGRRHSPQNQLRPFRISFVAMKTAKEIRLDFDRLFALPAKFSRTKSSSYPQVNGLRAASLRATGNSRKNSTAHSRHDKRFFAKRFFDPPCDLFSLLVGNGRPSLSKAWGLSVKGVF